MEWAQVLVIILSVFLAIFLLLGIVLLVLLIKISNRIKSVAGAAERTALKFEGVASNVAMFTSARSASKFVTSFLKNFKK
jgi:hypothetical protein